VPQENWYIEGTKERDKNRVRKEGLKKSQKSRIDL
jgi:hypothetical protein